MAASSDRLSPELRKGVWSWRHLRCRSSPRQSPMGAGTATSGMFRGSNRWPPWSAPPSMIRADRSASSLPSAWRPRTPRPPRWTPFRCDGSRCAPGGMRAPRRSSKSSAPSEKRPPNPWPRVCRNGGRPQSGASRASAHGDADGRTRWPTTWFGRSRSRAHPDPQPKVRGPAPPESPRLSPNNRAPVPPDCPSSGRTGAARLVSTVARGTQVVARADSTPGHDEPS